ncbi:MAG: beta-lactamase family protein [Anaerolineae bacterium]|nr:beta-lactamase family protein [Anaerolineae bacterium]
MQQSELDRHLDEAASAGQGTVYTAAACLVARGGETLFHRAYGWLDPETRTRPTQLDSLFDLASVTKVFTTTLFMRLVEAEQVSLDQPVAEVVPEFSGRRPITAFEQPLTGLLDQYDYPDTTVDAGRVTFRHLLTHTSGLPAWAALYRLPSREAAIQAVLHSTFAYPTGARLVYSDLGLILLSQAIERLAGQPLDQALRRLVLDPLDLRHTFYNPPAALHATVVPTEVCRWRGRRLVGEVHDENAGRLDGVSGHAGLFSTGGDVARLGQLYLNGGELDGVRLLSSSTVAEMTRVQVDFDGDRRGLGWMRQGTGEWQRPGLSEAAFGHTGFTGTSLWVDPTTQMVIVLLTNRVYFGRDASGILALRQAVYRAAEALVRS